ncbi:MAG: THUMP domain-containing protein [archaeon]
MYRGIVITNQGCEDIALQETGELISITEAKTDETVVLFEFKKLTDLCVISYMGQSISRAILLLGEFKVNPDLDSTLKNANAALEKSDLKSWLKRYVIECTRLGDHDFRSVDITSNLSRELKGIVKKNYKVEVSADFDNPEVIFFVYIYNNQGYIGVDFSGIDLSKRQYKIFNHPESLKGTTGYALVRESGFEKGIILDPFMGSGVIVIEAALYAAKFPVQYYSKDKLAFTVYDFFQKEKDAFFKKYDKLRDTKLSIFGYDSQFRFLKASQKNAKLAGIDKCLNLSRIEIEWLDTKFDKHSVDVIVTDPPRESKNKDTKVIKKVYQDLFNNADYILKKKGKIMIIAMRYELLDECAKNNKFKKTKNNLIYQGRECFSIMTYERDKE